MTLHILIFHKSRLFYNLYNITANETTKSTIMVDFYVYIIGDFYFKMFHLFWISFYIINASYLYADTVSGVTPIWTSSVELFLVLCGNWLQYERRKQVSQSRQKFITSFFLYWQMMPSMRSRQIFLSSL